MAAKGSTARWTCSRCEVTAGWMRGQEQVEHPAAWIEEKGEVYCLACRRARAAEAALNDAPPDLTDQRRAKLRAGALVEFEIRRDPERSNGEIARAIRTSVSAVMKARERLGVPDAATG
jgi:hypothetical protein